MASSDTILGISCDYHDAAAALVVDGEIVGAAAEERFSRRKHDPSLPEAAVRWLVEELAPPDQPLSAVAFYSKPFSTFHRVMASHARAGPRALKPLIGSVSSWGSTKLWVEYRVQRMLQRVGTSCAQVVFAEHHQSHAASAFYPSPFERAAVLTLDGVGEWTCGSIGVGRGRGLQLLREARYPDSLGLFYSAMAAYCGFEVNDGEHKFMGLAPYGEPRFERVLRDRVIDVSLDGSVRLDRRCFDFERLGSMTTRRLADVLGVPPSDLGQDPRQEQADLASSVQRIVDDVVVRSAVLAKELTGESALCLAGGVGLNCVANRTLVEKGPFDEVWIQPAAGDDGGALGAALWCHHQVRGGHREPPKSDAMSGSLLGPTITTQSAIRAVEAASLRGVAHDDVGDLISDVADRLVAGQVVGWCRGRMEFGPRALGARSILADPRRASTAGVVNRRTKGRESFRPLAPSVPVECAHEWFDLTSPSPYMLVTTSVTGGRGAATANGSFVDRLLGATGPIPACTHVDGSARVQTVDPDVNPAFHELLHCFGARSGVPVLLNTSFNRAGEPIVATAAQALACARAAGLDAVVLGDVVVDGSQAGW